MDFTPLRTALADVVAIPVTPYDATGAVDRDTYRALLRRLLDGGVRAVAPNGNTAGVYALTLAERRLCTHLSGEEAGDRAAVLVGVGQDVATAVDAVRHAREAGAPMG